MYAREKAVAISAVLKASLLAQKVQQQLIGSGGVTKKDKSPVTGTGTPFFLSSLSSALLASPRSPAI